MSPCTQTSSICSHGLFSYWKSDKLTHGGQIKCEFRNNEEKQSLKRLGLTHCEGQMKMLCLQICVFITFPLPLRQSMGWIRFINLYMPSCSAKLFLALWSLILLTVLSTLLFYLRQLQFIHYNLQKLVNQIFWGNQLCGWTNDKTWMNRFFILFLLLFHAFFLSFSTEASEKSQLSVRCADNFWMLQFFSRSGSFCTVIWSSSSSYISSISSAPAEV